MSQFTGFTQSLVSDVGAALEEFDVVANQEGFVGHRVLPTLDVARPLGQFARVKTADILALHDTLRASRADYNRGEYKGQRDSYLCEEHGWEEVVDHREAAMYSGLHDARVFAAKRAQHTLLHAAEKRIADAIFAAMTAASQETNGSDWTTWASGTPIADINGAITAVRNRTGMKPNTLVLDDELFRHVINCVETVDRVKHQGFQDARPGQITASMLAVTLNIEQVLVPTAMYNSATDRGVTATLAPIWGNTRALVAYVRSGGDISVPTLGRTFRWMTPDLGNSVGALVEEYEENRNRSTIVRVRHDIDEKLVYPELAQALTGLDA